MNRTSSIGVGVDGCRTGWFYTVTDGTAICETGIAPDIAWLWNQCRTAKLILIDIPIGLSFSSHRACDTEARRFLGARKSSAVFPPPCRKALYAGSYEEACTINHAMLGKKISKQAWGIVPKIREVDEFLQSHHRARNTILESHPEVCFRILAGKPVIHPKKRKEGVAERLRILSRYLPDTEDMLKSALARYLRKEVQPDDILDSMVLAVAARSGKDQLLSLPAKPETDDTGLRMQIVYPRRSPGSILNRTAGLHGIQRRISEMIRRSDSESRVFPATEVYNETWMLRLILDWYSLQPGSKHPLSFSKKCRWYSEVLLPTQFKAEYQGDPLSESWTHADGAIGQFAIGKEAKGDLTLTPGARRFIVTEAKMFSKLSPGVTHAKYFDQAARNVACIAETLSRAKRKPDKFSKLAFYVLAPSEQIDAGIFTKKMNRENIEAKVKRRVEEYADHRPKGLLKDKRDWYRTWFLPTLEKIHLRCIGWEELIEYMKLRDLPSGKNLHQFYKKCLEYNGPER